jgi:hypothetical protein
MGPCITSCYPIFQRFIQSMISWDTFTDCALLVAHRLADLAIPNASKTSISLAIISGMSFCISKRSSNNSSENSDILIWRPSLWLAHPVVTPSASKSLINRKVQIPGCNHERVSHAISMIRFCISCNLALKRPWRGNEK